MSHTFVAGKTQARCMTGERRFGVVKRQRAKARLRVVTRTLLAFALIYD